MTPQVTDSIPDSLEETGKYIEVAGRHHITSKKKGQVQIKMCDNKIDIFIATFWHQIYAIGYFQLLS